MGTQLQSKRFSTGYCSIWGLNENVRNDIWSLYHEDKSQKIGQYCGSLLPRHLTIDGSLGYEKEKVRQTILKHESTFRHQLKELHRLYGRQRELMDVFRRRDARKCQIEAETSNLSLFSSHVSSEDAKPTWHVSNTAPLHLVFGQSSISESTGKQSLPGFSNEKRILAFPSRDYGNSNMCDLPNSKGDLVGRRMIDLEIPADMYMNNEEKQLGERCGLPGVESNSARSTHEILHDRDVKSSFLSALNYHHNIDASRSSSHLKTNNELADLNEPILLEETSISVSGDNPDDLSCTLDNIQPEDVSATSDAIIHPLWKGTSLVSRKETDGGNCLNSVQSTNERNEKEQLAYDFRPKLMRPHTHSITRDVCSRGSCVALQSSQAEHRETSKVSTSEQGKTECQIKRKLFGVHIFEVNDEPLVTEINMANHSNNFDELSSTRSFLQVKVSVDSSAKSFPSSIKGVSNQNGASLSSELNTKQSQGNASVDCNFTNNTTTNDLVPKESTPKDLVKPVEVLDCLGWKSAKVLKTATETSNAFHDDVALVHKILSADCQSEQKILKGTPLYLIETVECAERRIANRNSYHLNLDSLQNTSHQFFKNNKGTSISSHFSIQKQENIEDRKTEVDECSSTKVNYSLLTRNGLSISKDLSFPDYFSKPSCLAANADNAGNGLVEKDVSGDLPGAKDLNLEEPINNSLSCLRCHIDLNLSLIEEEAPSAPCLPTSIVKLATTEIDLEVPTVLDTEADKEIKMSSDELREPCEELVRLAAEAILSISLSSGQNNVNDATCGSLEAALNDSLKWFVEVVSSYECHEQSLVGDANLCADGALTEEVIPDGMDYFEFMTLKLTDAKSDNYSCDYKVPIFKNQDHEETKVNTLSRRPRRGQARRGRQRKDFQRDILPSLIPLSKLEVTEDIQTFEELLRASGCTWQSSLSRKSTAKNGRGRRRTGILPPPQETEAVCPPMEQKHVSRELHVEDKTLSGWGKRTRRLPRQRHMTGTPALPLNH